MSTLSKEFDPNSQAEHPHQSEVVHNEVFMHLVRKNAERLHRFLVYAAHDGVRNAMENPNKKWIPQPKHIIDIQGTMHQVAENIAYILMLLGKEFTIQNAQSTSKSLTYVLSKIIIQEQLQEREDFHDKYLPVNRSIAIARLLGPRLAQITKTDIQEGIEVDGVACVLVNEVLALMETTTHSRITIEQLSEEKQALIILVSILAQYVSISIPDIISTSDLDPATIATLMEILPQVIATESSGSGLRYLDGWQDIAS